MNRLPSHLVTNSSGTLAWTWDRYAFGDHAPNTNPGGLGTFTYNPRFAGQMADSESGLNYNLNRDYNPTAGRYIESDPIGLYAGVNTYKYAYGQPTTFTDPWGLKTVVIVDRSPIIGGMGSYGSHSAVYVDNGGNPMLYDPGGQYNPLDAFGDPQGGSGDYFTGSGASLPPYVQFENSTGDTLDEYTFNTTADEEKQIVQNIDNEGGKIPGFCTVGVSNVINGVGPFQDINAIFPGTLGKQLSQLPGVSLTTSKPR